MMKRWRLAQGDRYTCSIFYFACDHPPNSWGKLYTLVASQRKFVYLGLGRYDYLFQIVYLFFWPIEKSRNISRWNLLFSEVARKIEWFSPDLYSHLSIIFSHWRISISPWTIKGIWPRSVISRETRQIRWKALTKNIVKTFEANLLKI